MKRQFLTLLVITILTTFGCNENKKDCKRFHQGTFTGMFPMGDKQVKFTVTRNDKIQTEKNEETGAVTRLSITWPDDCTYQLKFLNTTEKLAKEDIYLREKIVLTTHIINTSNSYYIFKTKGDLVDIELSDTLWLLGQY